MKPEVKKILQKFSTEKVELNVISDAKKVLNQSEKIRKDAEGLESKVEKI